MSVGSSSNITEDSTPIKLRKARSLVGYEDIGMLEAISSLIEETIKKNLIKKKYSKKSVFFTEEQEIPKLSIYQYIYSIYSYLNLEMSSIVLSLITLNRLLDRTKDFLSLNNFYKLFITSCLLNCKQNEDINFNFDMFVLSGKIDKKELIQLEKKYFVMINYKLFVNDEVYKRYYNFIKNRVKKTGYNY